MERNTIVAEMQKTPRKYQQKLLCLQGDKGGGNIPLVVNTPQTPTESSKPVVVNLPGKPQMMFKRVSVAAIPKSQL